MKRLQINTTQNVKIHFKLANLGQRVLAFGLDNILKIGYWYLAFYVFNLTSVLASNNSDYWSKSAIFVIVMSPIFLYSLVSEILMNGQTIGKKALRIRVINVDGFKPSIADYVMRWFLRIVDFNIFFILAVYIFALDIGDEVLLALAAIAFVGGKFVGFISVIVTEKSQRIGDISANTVVIYLKDDAKFSQTISEDLQENYSPTYANVVRLSDNDARIIKDTFATASKRKDYATLIKLRKKIEEVTEIRSKEESDEIFIDKVLKDYNYYTQNM